MLLIKETGGSDGVLDENLLESALNAPFQSFSSTETFPSIQQKAARLGLLFFLALNGIELEYTQEELANIIMKVAAGEYSFEDLLHWIIQHQC